MRYGLHAAPLRRESQHVGDASREELVPSSAELPAALRRMGPLGEGRRFLTSLQPGNMPLCAGSRLYHRVMGSVLQNSLFPCAVGLVQSRFALKSV